jgi:hypothetical protein
MVTNNILLKGDPAEPHSNMVEVMNDMAARYVTFYLPEPETQVVQSSRKSVNEVLIRDAREQGLRSLPPKRTFMPANTEKMDGDNALYNDMLSRESDWQRSS